MKVRSLLEPGASPARMLEMLSDRFGAFEAIAYSTIKLARFVPQDELSIIAVRLAESTSLVMRCATVTYAEVPSHTI